MHYEGSLYKFNIVLNVPLEISRKLINVEASLHVEGADR